MNIKSLLLGSAAALAAVSGAQAADAIVAAEPEPMEYVRVCDAFGTGYFYIPGTETCLKIGGYVRYDVQGGDILGRDTDGDGKGDAWYKNTRFTLNTSTASDTEYGALKTFTETRFNYDDASRTSLKFAYIDLAGFRVGKDESAFLTYVGYLGNIIMDDLLIPAGDYDVNLISYTYKSDNGFSAMISLEDDNGDAQYATIPSDGDGYMPNVVGGLGYTAGTWSIKGVAAYDDPSGEAAFKIRADATFGAFSAWIMGGYKTTDEAFFYGNWGPGIGGQTTNYGGAWGQGGGGDWAVWGGASYAATEKVAINGQLSYNDADDFQANLNVAFTVVPGFTITPEVAYVQSDNLGTGDDDSWGGVVRFQRSF